MWIHGLRSGPPASSSSTRYLPDSLSRPATAQPAEPAPVTMKSKVSAAPATISPRPTSASAVSDLNQTDGGREGRRADDYSALSVCDDRIDVPSGSRHYSRIEEHPPVFADRLCSPDDHLPHLRVGVAGRRIQRAAARRARLVRHRAMG